MRHRRTEPPVEFRYPLTLAYVDLDELPELLGGRLTRSGFGPLRFRRGDYLGGAGAGPLADAVRSLVQRQIGRAADGPIRLLTALRTFGTLFNPVSFYYAFAADGERVEAIVADVTNTPWGERHAYVLPVDDGSRGRVLSASFAKQFHVSPFMAMDHRYTLRATPPAQTLSLHVESRRDGEQAFDATLALRRRELDRAAVLGYLARFPLAGLRVRALIYGNAVRLKLRGAPYFSHPQRAGAA